MMVFDEGSLRQQVSKAMEAEDWTGAEIGLRRLWQQRPVTATAHFVISSAERMRELVPFRACRVLLLRSFTLEPVIPTLRAAAYTHRIDLSVRLGGFNSYAQELLDSTSEVYKTPWDAVILAVDLADIAPDLAEGYQGQSGNGLAERAKEVVAQFESFAQVFREHSSAPLILHNLAQPARPSDGSLDGQRSMGQAQAIRQINMGLNELAGAYRDIYVLDYDSLAAGYGRDRWHDERMRLTTRFPIAADAMPTLANEWLRFLCPIAGRICKVLVTDLDQTLWGGVIGEDGIDGIRLDDQYPGAAYVAVQKALLDLQRRGIVLAIASKNNREDAMEALSKHPNMLLRPGHFVAERINWGEKCDSIREIAAELNLGLDAVAFMDDNPIERERVRSVLPEVTVLELPANPLAYVPLIQDCPEFQRLRLSEEDSQRTVHYQEQRQRQEILRSADTVEEFFRSLDQQVEISPVTSANVTRVAQLTQKTNQFNATTRRYTELQISEMAARPDYGVFAVRVKDRLGDNGLTGVMITRIEGERCEIDAFLLSCRVMSRMVETAMLAFLVQRCRTLELQVIEGSIIPSAKNGPVRDLYQRHGFQPAEGDSGGRWKLAIDAANIQCPEWIRLHASDDRLLHELATR